MMSLVSGRASGAGVSGQAGPGWQGEAAWMRMRRDRKRFERAVARAMRPSRRSSAIQASWTTIVPRLARRSWPWPGIVLAIIVVGLAVSYASLPWSTSRKVDDAQAARPATVAEPAREADARRPAEAREAHLRQLQPVLRRDADKLSEIARRARVDGHVTDFGRDRSDSVQRALSEDVQNHYPEYSQAKERLRLTVVEQEEELQRATQLVMTKVRLSPGAEPRRLEVARALVAKCFDRGSGMTLTAPATEDEREAFESFTSFQPDADVAAHCQSLKRRAAGISANARKLSTEVRALAERTTLPGECKYTRSEQASGS